MLVQVPFNNLPEETRARLAQTLVERAKDKASISDTGQGLFWLGWIIALLGLLGLAWRVFSGLGVPWDENALHGPAVTMEFLIYGSMVGLPLPWLLVRHIRRRACPFPPGRYLLPADYVDARDPVLHIVPIQEALSIQIARNDSIARLSLDFDGPSGHRIREVFTVRGADRIGPAIDGFLAKQAAHDDAIARGDESALRAMDPLYAVRSRGWSTLHLGELEPEVSTRVRPIPWWTRGMILWFPVAMACASLVLASVRDRVSDALVFELLQAEDSTGGWQWYLDQGGKRSAEVRSKYLRDSEDAEHELAFTICLDQASVSCWNSWLAQYAGVPRYEDAVRQVEQRLKPQAALDEALAAGSVAALREYQESMAQGVGGAFSAEAKREIADSIAGARASLVSQLVDDEDLVSAVAGMMGWLEARGDTKVDVRFEGPEEAGLAEIDAWIESSYGVLVPVYDEQGGQVAEVPIAPLAPQFQYERTLHREQKLFAMLQGGFAAVVPSDIIDLEHGAPLAPGEPLGDIFRPTITLRIGVSPVRNKASMIQVLLPPEVYGDDPNFDGVYGLPSIRFQVELGIHLPGIESPFTEKFKIEPPADKRAVHSTLEPYDGGLEPTGVSAMVNRGYWLTGGALRRALFRDGTEAHGGMRLAEDGVLLRAMVVTMLADGVVQEEPDAGSHANEREQIRVMMEKLSGLVLSDVAIDREILWVRDRMGGGGWIDRVARGRELIIQPLISLPQNARISIPLAVGWMGQVYQMEADRAQGGLSSSEQLLLTSVLDAIGMSHEDFAREWDLLFSNQG